MSKRTSAEDDDEDKRILRDGEVLRVRMSFMDDLQRAVAADAAVGDALHRPGSLPLSDAERRERRALYDAYDQAVGERWRAPPPVIAAAPTGDRSSVFDAYDAYDKRISDRWRGAA